MGACLQFLQLNTYDAEPWQITTCNSLPDYYGSAPDKKIA